MATDEDLAVRRDDHVPGLVVITAEVGGHDAVATTEVGVHRSRRRQPGYGPVVGVIADHDDLAVGVDSHGSQEVGGSCAQIEGVDAVRTKRRVERPGSRVAGNEEVLACVSHSGDDDLAVGVDFDRGDVFAVSTVVLDHFAVRTE